MFRCANCGREYGLDLIAWRCAHCTGLLNMTAALTLDQAQVTDVASMWRYRHTFPLDASVQPITLGEGNTPLVKVELPPATPDAAKPQTVYLKCEYQNPTGSHLDRAMSVLVSQAVQQGATDFTVASSGNAAVSLGHYLAEAGQTGTAHVPINAALDKLAAVPDGLSLNDTGGQFSSAYEAAEQHADSGAYYASVAHHPLALTALATIAYEIVADLGQAPSAVVAPAGQGSLLLSLYLGFQALLQAKLIAKMPRLLGVQTEAVAPLWAVMNYGFQALSLMEENATLAVGLQVMAPVRGDSVMSALHVSQGDLATVNEMQIEGGRVMFERIGHPVESTAASVWFPMRAILNSEVTGPVVAILTGKDG